MQERSNPHGQQSRPTSRRTGILEWGRTVLGLDKAITFTILARGWSSAAGVITVMLIARFLSLDEQGYYYTFGSLVALQIVFELGFSYVILQMASHEIVHLTLSPTLTLSGDPVAHARLASVLQKAVRWYSTAALLMALILIPAGFLFFRTHQHDGSAPSWKLAWCTTVLAAAVAFQLDPLLSFLEGCGFVSRIARLRLAQAAAGSILAWIALITHHGLFAPAMMIMGTASTTFVWLWRKKRFLLDLLKHPPGMHRVGWRQEVWPFQWRIAVSWLSGYFIFQLFNPVLFAFKGPTAAGQMGMSLSLVNALQAVAVSWISTKSAPFGAMIARKNYKELDTVFFRSLRQSLFVFLAGGSVAWLGCVYLNREHLRAAQRLLDPSLLGLLLLVGAMNVIVTAQALYLRAHKQEKFLLNSVLGALLVSLSTYFLGRRYGAEGIIVGFFIISLFLGLGGGTYVFRKYRNIWHASEA